jgi:hypothetical protein
VVERNEIVMSLPGAAPGQQSAAVQVEGSAADTTVRRNRISGRALAALSVMYSDFSLDMPDGTSGRPDDTAFLDNELDGFVATPAGPGLPFADAMIGLDINGLLVPVPGGAGASDTTIRGDIGSIVDDGTDTRVIADRR